MIRKSKKKKENRKKRKINIKDKKKIRRKRSIEVVDQVRAIQWVEAEAEIKKKDILANNL